MSKARIAHIVGASLMCCSIAANVMITGPAWLIALELQRIANSLPAVLALVEASFLRAEFRASLAELLVERACAPGDDRAA